MNLWLDTLSKRAVEGIDTRGVRDADQWVERLHAAGHPVFTTSGTSGKHSFINQSERDVEFSKKALMPAGVVADRSRPVFVLGPRRAPNRASAFFAYLADACGRPGAVYFLTDETLRITELSQMATMRKRIAEGVATPSEIAGYVVDGAGDGRDGQLDPEPRDVRLFLRGIRAGAFHDEDPKRMVASLRALEQVQLASWVASRNRISRRAATEAIQRQARHLFCR